MKHCLLYMFLVTFCSLSILWGNDKSKFEIPTMWEEGYLDIHHINTGRGNCTFIIFPDGTTLLIDAGDNNRLDERSVKPKPDSLESAAECIIKYIKYFMPKNHDRNIDYCLITHFHSDHLGAVYVKKANKGNYYLTGISEVYDELPVVKIVDRGYHYMCPGVNSRTFINYKKFIDYISQYDSTQVEAFEVGSDKQFPLKFSSEKYNAEFQIQNIYANGVLWVSERKQNIDLFPETETFTDDNMPHENMYSCVIKLTYGDFKYYTGGDIPGYPKIAKPKWHDIESPVSKQVGHVNVAVLNHHGYEDSTNEIFVSALSPQVFIAQTWNAAHLTHAVLNRILSKKLYKQTRDIYTTNTHPAAKIVTGKMIDKLNSTQGHIMIRVKNGGGEFNVYVLDDSKSTSYNMISKYGPYLCK